MTSGIKNIKIKRFYHSLNEINTIIDAISQGKLTFIDTHKDEKVHSISIYTQGIKRKIKNPKNIFVKLLNKIPPNINVEVHSFEEASYSINQATHHFKQQNKQEKNNVTYNFYYDKWNPISVFENQLIQLAHENYANINHKNKKLDAIEIYENLLYKEKDDTAKKEANKKFLNHLKEFKENIKHHILLMDENIFYEDLKKHRINKNIDKAFEELQNNLIYTIEEGDKFLLKEISKTLIELVVDIASYARYGYVSLGPIAATLIHNATQFYLNTYDFLSNTKYYNAISLPILKLLRDEIALCFCLCKKSYYSNYLIINNAILVEFSGFNTDILNTQIPSYLYQGFGFIARIENEENLEQINHITKTCTIISQTDTKTENKDLIQLITNKCHNSLLLNYIEYPTFDSCVFAEIIRKENEEKSGKQGRENASRKCGLNYLIISNAPSYESAGLRGDIIEKILQYKIEGRKQLRKPIGEYKPTIDYSQYKIHKETKKEDTNVLRVVSLSPFVYMHKIEYDGFKARQSELSNKFHKECSDNFGGECQGIINEEKKLTATLDYVDYFFRKMTNYKEIVEKSKALFDKFADTLKKHLDNLNQNKKEHQYGIFEVLVIALYYSFIKEQLEQKDKEVDYQVLHQYKDIQDMQFLSLMDKEYSKQTTKSYQAIQYKNHTFKFLLEGAYIALDNGEKIYVSLDKNNQERDKKYLVLDTIYTILTTKEQNSFNAEFNAILKDEIKAFREKENIKSSAIANKNVKNILNGLEQYNQAIQEDAKLLIKELSHKNSGVHTISKSATNPFIQLDKQFKEHFTEEFYQNSIEPYNLMQEVFDRILSAFFPLYDFMNFKMESISKRLLEYLFSNASLKDIIQKEMGLLYLPFVLKDISYDSTYAKLSEYKNYIAKKSLLLQLQSQKNNAIKNFLEYEINLNISHNKEYRAIYLSHSKVISPANRIHFKEFLKDALKEFIVGLGVAFLTRWIDREFQTHYERVKEELDNLIFDHFTYKYDEPYALKNENFVSYPMRVQSNFMYLNFRDLLYGGQLCTGGLKYHLGNVYCIEDSEIQLKDIMINKILYYLLLDHERHGIDIKQWVNELQGREIYKPTPGTCREIDVFDTQRTFKEPREYKIESESALYLILQPNNKSDKAMEAYNKALDILQDFKEEKYFTNAENKEHISKSAEFLECLDIIGQHNIKALYEGVKQENKNNPYQKTIHTRTTDKTNNDCSNSNRQLYPVGRLATTIIMDGGLWIG